MRETYKLMKKMLISLASVFLFVFLFGVLSFSFMYETTSYSLKFPHVITILFYVLIATSVILAVLTTIRPKHIHITRIKKQNMIYLFGSGFVAVMMLVMFVYEAIVVISRADLTAYYVLRVSRWLLCLPTCGYFILNLIPNRIKNKKITIPLSLRAIFAFSTILWIISSLFTTYFNKTMLTTDIAKVTQLLAYVLLALFIIYDVLFDFSGKGVKFLIFFALMSSVVTVSFQFSIIFCKIIATYSTTRAFSIPEMFTTVALGLYGFSKVAAIAKTLLIVSDSRAESTHSHKFDAPSEHHHHHHDTEAIEEKPVEEGQTADVTE